MPLFATLALNLMLGTTASLAAARELRASPRAVHQARSFRAVALHELLIAMPIAAFLLIRFSDWSVSYLTDGARLPSAIVVGLILLHAALALGGFALGARLLRDHRARWVRNIAALTAGAVLLGVVVFHERLGIVATFAQFRGGFGLRSFWHSTALEASIGLLLVWAGAAGHLLWSLARRL